MGRPISIGFLTTLLLSTQVAAEQLNLSCEFDPGFTTVWEYGAVITEADHFSANGVIGYHIDTESEYASYSTDAGGGTAKLVPGSAITMIETTHTGVSITTIFPSSSKSKRHPAVISRHVDVLGPMPSQYYGWCTSQR